MSSSAISITPVLPKAHEEARNMCSQADELLRAALQEMDEIMKGGFDNFFPAEDLAYNKVRTCCEDLCSRLKQCSDQHKALEKLSEETSVFLRAWLTTPKNTNNQSEEGAPVQVNQINSYNISNDETGYSSSNHSSNSSESRQQDTEIENFKYQITNLQSIAQDSSRKLREMEARLASTNEKLVKAEERLHKEQVNKTYMESHKLDLMAEVAELRMRLHTVETERADYRERYEGLQKQVLDLHEKLILKDREMAELKSHTGRNGYYTNGVNGKHIISADSETVTLKKTISDLVTASQEKDRRISELRKAVNAYQRVEEIILQSHGRPRSSGSDSYGSSNDKTVKPIERAERHNEQQNGIPTATSTPVVETVRIHKLVNGHNPLTQVSAITGTPIAGKDGQLKRSNSFDAAEFSKVIVEAPSKPISKTPAPIRKNLGNNINQAKKDKEDMDFSEEDEVPLRDDFAKKKKSGFRKFFTKLKKSSSQEAIDEMNGQPASNGFKRGGIRATAGARLGWGAQNRTGTKKPDRNDDIRTPFHQWDAEQVIQWLNDIGLTMYATEYKRWNKNGQQLLEATQQDIDKELRLCNPLHRKKIHLALEAERNGSIKDKILYDLSPEWVSKWLDDIGLPQYKDQFYEARVDSRMLNFLTVEDLLYMKISNALHHASIRRGIELMRKSNFNLSALKRRPSSGNENDIQSSNDKNSSEFVSLWTNHRVMEWLRSIDLSEYVANLRGSGVHGALILWEQKFTVEHLATILNIPPSKTLLRRHLMAHFVNLVGKSVQDQKAGDDTGFKLELNAKVKSKKNPFKKGRSSTSEYLCPIGLEPIDARAEEKRITDAVALYKKELSKQHSVN